MLDILVTRLESRPGSETLVVQHFQFATFCLLALMCFGDELNETQILEIHQVQREIVVNLQRFLILNLWPKLMKILLRKRWKEYLQLKNKQHEVVNSPRLGLKNFKNETFNYLSVLVLVLVLK